MGIKRTATSIWEGNGKKGKGKLSAQSGALDNIQYGFGSRFEEGVGTNPEELIGAAHSGCFNMKLAFNLQEAGFEAKSLHTEAEIVFDDGAVTHSNLTLTAHVDGIEADKFDELVKDAKVNCPISKLLDTQINLEYTLNA